MVWSYDLECGLIDLEWSVGDLEFTYGVSSVLRVI
jgi:hypothetical protein